MDLKLRNHIFQLINEYYPDNINDYLFSKYKLLMQVKVGNRQAEERLDQEDIVRLKAYIDKTIAVKIKNELIRKNSEPLSAGATSPLKQAPVEVSKQSDDEKESIEMINRPGRKSIDQSYSEESKVTEEEK